MARTISRSVRDDTEPVEITINKFDKGFMSLLEQSRIPPDGASQATDVMLVQDGVWQSRWGTQNYGAASPDGTDIDGAAEYVTSAGATQLVIVSNGKVYRSTDGGSWTQITGATLTAGKRCRFLESDSRLYIFNGTDNLTYYDGSTLNQFTSISTPAAPTLNRGAGLSAGSTTYYYQIVATNSVGFTPGGTEASVSVNKVRENWAVASNEYVDVVITRVTGAARYDIYISDQSGFEVYLDSIADPGSGGTVTYRDDGTAAANEFAEVPVSNTTTGPKFKHACLSGNRIWATQDTTNLWRVSWTGTGQYRNYFSSFYGGGWIDIDKGSVERPYAVVDYRSGKGDPILTVLTSSPEGNGSLWHIDLTTATVGSSTILVPTAVRVPGQGTSADSAVVKVRNDIFFINQKGVYQVGSTPTVLNVLTTDEVSGNIRPTVRALQQSHIADAAGYYYDAKIFFAVPESGGSNNRVYVLDTERKAWALPWNISVKQFLEYQDTGGTTHFLAVPSSGSRLMEISSSFLDDSGTPFNSRYSTALLPVNRDRFAWAHITEALFEFSGLQGTVSISVLGTQKTKTFSTVASRAVSSTTSNAGIGSHLFGEALFSECTPAPLTFTQPSDKKRLKVNKLLNNIQGIVSANSGNTKWTLLTIKFRGYLQPTSYPQSWRN